VMLIVSAWFGLVAYDILSLAGFGAIHRLVVAFPTRSRSPREEIIARVCRAVDEACVWYVKRSYCLQRSAVTTCLLRWCGVQATLVIGYRPVPIDSHAWVEVDGRVVNDRPQYQKFFLVLDRL
jgi:hypothetical protein